MIIDEVMKEASTLGACMNLSGVKDWKRFVNLFFSPMGREFCEANNFPTIDQFRAMKGEAGDYNVFVDSGNIELKNGEQIALVGDTNADLFFDDNSSVHKVILMHGAKARIKATHYTVILLINMGECEVEIEKDETVKIL